MSNFNERVITVYPNRAMPVLSENLNRVGLFLRYNSLGSDVPFIFLSKYVDAKNDSWFCIAKDTCLVVNPYAPKCEFFVFNPSLTESINVIVCEIF